MIKKELINSLKFKGFEEHIVDAFSKVKRENFIPSKLRKYAYNDEALPIGEGQTTSQPYTIATMLSMLDLKEGQKILEIGSGSGYVLALISEIVGKKGKVFGVEKNRELARKSKLNLKGYKAKVYFKNGYNGLKEYSTYDRVIISAACNEIPKPLIKQLKKDAIVLAPIGNKFQQSLTIYKKIDNQLVFQEEIPGFQFVPFLEKD